ncbi:glycosyltransferase family 4 protein [Pleurocapsales cyanobacterium LEGE 06147]|nr:glycosyltransferase family 4 protein [Pleurocapsales cyanobacterium LEGE 06147]
MKLTLIIFSFSSGGAERVMSIMANYWTAKGWKITLLSFVDRRIPPFYDLDSRIDYIPLGIAAESPNPIIAIWNNWKRIRRLRTAIDESKPDAAISFLSTTNAIALLATRGLKIPTIVSERTDPTRYFIGKIWEQLRQWTYLFADRIVVQTRRTLDYFPSQLQARACIIPNPVLEPPRANNSSDKIIGDRSLIAMGRLEYQKGFDLLLQAFAKLKDRYPEWTLTILGEGTLRQELESLCNQLELTDRVHLLGRRKNPYKFLKQAKLFVMSSRFEGFPNALCEAMACGLPVISTDCPTGPREIIRNGVDGILVPNEDVSALAAVMERLMSDEAERKRLATRAPEVTERFSLEKVMGMWEELLDQVVKKKFFN